MAERRGRGVEGLGNLSSEGASQATRGHCEDLALALRGAERRRVRARAPTGSHLFISALLAQSNSLL